MCEISAYYFGLPGSVQKCKNDFMFNTSYNFTYEEVFVCVYKAFTQWEKKIHSAIFWKESILTLFSNSINHATGKKNVVLLYGFSKS